MLDSFVNKVTGLEDCNLNVKKETPTHVYSSECCQIFKNAYFEERMWKTAFEYQRRKSLSKNLI